MGCFYTDPTTSKPTFRNYFPASLSPGDAIAFVADDPDQLFIAQQDSVGSNLVAADLNLNANLVFGAGSTTTGISGVEIDSSTGATTATHQVRLLLSMIRQVTTQQQGTTVTWLSRLTIINLVVTLVLQAYRRVLWRLIEPNWRKS